MIGAATLALGAIQTGVGIYQASQAQDPTQVEETAEMKKAREEARKMAQGGFTAQETAAFKQALAAQDSTDYKRATDMGGGNLAAAFRGALNARKLNALNKFASDDANLMRQNQRYSNSLEQGYQSLKNTQVGQQNALAAQQAGAAQQSINSGMSNLGSALNLQQALNYQPNMGGGGSNAPMTQTPAYGYSDIPTMTPSGQVVPVGLGNYQIGANSNVTAPSNPYMFQQQQNYGGLNGMRYDYLTGKWVY